jgi:hypothetical protein
MAGCARCGGELRNAYRFCPWCAEPQRRKVVEFFEPHRRDAGLALRVSRYYDDDPQVRFSVWDDGAVQAAVSLDEWEALRLASFLAGSALEPQRPRLATRLRDVAERVISAHR